MTIGAYFKEFNRMTFELQVPPSRHESRPIGAAPNEVLQKALVDDSVSASYPYRRCKDMKLWAGPRSAAGR